MLDDWQVLRSADLRRQGWTRSDVRRAAHDDKVLSVGRGLLLAGGTDPPTWPMAVAIAAARCPDGLVSGEAAAALYGLDGFDEGVPIAMQIGPTRSGRQPGTVRRPLLQGPEVICGLPVTGIEETLLNLGADVVARPGCAAASQVLTAEELVELAVECALHRRLTSIRALSDLVHDSPPKRRGRAVLRGVLERRGEVPPTESYLETRFVQVLRAAGVAAFERQVDVDDGAGRPIGRVDFLQGPVVVECVGRQYHDGREDLDVERIARLTAAGYDVLPFRFAHVEHRQHHVVHTTAAALVAAGVAPAARFSGRRIAPRRRR